MSLFRTIGHCIAYPVWLTGQVIKESVVMAVDTLGTGRHIAPVVIYYPLRVTKERDIAAFMASITMTPGTLALGVTGPKEVDYDAAAGKRSSKDAFAVARSEYGTHGLTHVQRFLAVHAMYGSEPEELLADLAHMEEKLAPSVRGKKLNFKVENLVERGRPGPRGFRGSRGGRASDETVFDVEKVDPTPHASAFVSAIMAMDDDDDDSSGSSSSSSSDATTGTRLGQSKGDQPEKNKGRFGKKMAERRDARKQRKAANAKPDVDSRSGDSLGASRPDREGRTKPGETLYDPLYPNNRPKGDHDVDGSERWKNPPKSWAEEEKAAREKERAKKKKAEQKKRQEN